MSTLEIVVRIAAGVVLTSTNAFFVVTEFALTRLRQFSERRVREDRRLRRGWEMTEELEIYLTGCQLGITTSSILLGVVAEPAVTHLLRPVFQAVGLQGATASTVSVIAAVVVINLIHKIWGEQAPTYLGVERPLEVARWAAPVLYWWTKVTYPVIKLGDGAAKLTLRAIGVEMERSWVEQEAEAPSGESGREPGRSEDRDGRAGPRGSLLEEMGEVLARSGVAPDRREEVLRAVEIEDVPVREIMVPASDVVAWSEDAPLEENLDRVREAGFSRYPLIGDGLGDYRGILYASSLLPALDAIRAGDTGVRELAAEPVEVRPEMAVADFIDYLQDQAQELALVRDGDEVVGLVTVTDAVEAILGELRDPLDPRVEGE
ncbi:MAG: CNNM domain-containing protein [Candidatus Longimicrobiales bacterium M2_2A_002]